METKVQKIDLESESYPYLLKNIENPPKILYCMGNMEVMDKLSVAIVGARKCTDYGRMVTKNIVDKLVDYEITVISGMAKGIDSVAHKQTLKNNGKTIAVLGTGIDFCFPASNKTLRDEILKENLIISEYPEGYPGSKYTFPMRNRIISGLSQGVVVIEAGIKSGSLITAECAAEQGKFVFAVPGNVTSPNSIGTNKLIKDGATLAINGIDIINELGLVKQKKENIKIQLGKDEKKIVDILKFKGETNIDCISMMSDFTVQEVKALITIMEIKGIVFSDSGKIYIANL